MPDVSTYAPATPVNSPSVEPKRPITHATASGYKKHYETTLERVRDYSELVMSTDRFRRAINNLDKIRKGEIDLRHVPEETLSAFLEEFNLLDPRTFVLTS